MKPNDVKTWGDMCQFIEEQKVLKKNDGTHPTADEIWNYSPTGELASIPEWYELAKLKYNQTLSQQ